jgi:myo-inositol-1(or 4)-monophosphatase
MHKDRESENLVLTRLKTEFPNHKLIGEESADDKIEVDDSPTWMVDPLDGNVQTEHLVHNFEQISRA